MATPTRYLKVTSKNVFLPSGDPQRATITVDRTSGKIISIDLGYIGEGAAGHAHANTQVLDAGQKHVLPGLIDGFEPPAPMSTWEGFWTGTRAAVSGGITTVVDMPLDSIPPQLRSRTLSSSGGPPNVSVGPTLPSGEGLFQLGLSLLWTEGSKPERGVTLDQVVRWMSGRTAEQAGLSATKGLLVVDLDGDLVIWDAKAEFKVSGEDLYFKNKLSAYEGLTLKGVVQRTFLRGH